MCIGRKGESPDIPLPPLSMQSLSPSGIGLPPSLPPSPQAHSQLEAEGGRQAKEETIGRLWVQIGRMERGNRKRSMQLFTAKETLKRDKEEERRDCGREGGMQDSIRRKGKDERGMR